MGQLDFLKYPTGWDGTKVSSRGMGWDEFLIPWDFLFLSDEKIQLLCF
jgi:hypothetical protein